MSNIKFGSHMGMAGMKCLHLRRKLVSYGANVFMLYTGAPRIQEEKKQVSF